ncbi:hypothetical protein HGA34_03425 [Candidatus Falkowbacteria bacterium]|nr:hypothetical protein [Candidatus Falkowbacteria bacterium]
MIWFIFFLIFIPLLSVAAASLSLIVWVPTRKHDLPRILELAELKPGDRFIDLGCGTGTVPRYAAANCQADIYGIELALPFYFWCLTTQFFGGRRNINYLWGDLFKHSLAGYDVVYVFGIPDKLKSKLRPKLERELKAGARVISYAFAIEGWTPDKISRPEPQKASIYLYKR